MSIKKITQEYNKFFHNLFLVVQKSLQRNTEFFPPAISFRQNTIKDKEVQNKGTEQMPLV